MRLNENEKSGDGHVRKPVRAARVRRLRLLSGDKKRARSENKCSKIAKPGAKKLD